MRCEESICWLVNEAHAWRSMAWAGSPVGRLAAALGARGTIVSYAALGGDVTSGASVLDIIFKDLTYRGFYLDKPEYGIEDVGRAIAHVQKGGKALLKLGI